MIERIDMKCNLSHENGVEIKKCECGVEALMRRCPFEETTCHYMGRDENKALRQILSHQLYRYTFQAVDCLQARESLVECMEKIHVLIVRAKLVEDCHSISK